MTISTITNTQTVFLFVEMNALKRVRVTPLYTFLTNHCKATQMDECDTKACNAVIHDRHVRSVKAVH